MKRKIAAMLTLALTVTTVCVGCGGDKQSTGEKSKTDSKTVSLSEGLDDQKVIAYRVSKIDKSKVPGKIYFFEDGKVTIIPGDEFDKTLGDFAKMSDDEIWEEYEDVRKQYKEDYNADEIKKVNEELTDANETLEMYKSMTEEFDKGNVNQGTAAMCLQYLESVDYTRRHQDVDINDYYNKLEELTEEFVPMTSFFTDDMISEIKGVSGLDELAQKIHYNAELVENDDTQTLVALGEKNVESINEKLDELKAGPFYDLPFILAAETDSTGNAIETEKLVVPSEEYLKSISGIETTVNRVSDNEIKFVGNVSEAQVYDTTYNCIAIKNSSSSDKSLFCTRNSFVLDDTKSKDVLIDEDSKSIDKQIKTLTKDYE